MTFPTYYVSHVQCNNVNLRSGRIINFVTSPIITEETFEIVKNKPKQLILETTRTSPFEKMATTWVATHVIVAPLVVAPLTIVPTTITPTSTILVATPI